MKISKDFNKPKPINTDKRTIIELTALLHKFSFPNIVINVDTTNAKRKKNK